MTTENKFKWTDEATAQLRDSVSAFTSAIPYAEIESIAEAIGTSARSVAAKLRSLDYAVETKGAKPSTFSAEDTAVLGDFLNANAGKYDIHQLAEVFLNGKYTSKQLQGKVLAMELSHALLPTPKKEVPSKYTHEQEDKIVALVNEGAFIEDIAEALGADVKSIRGKLLSMLRKEQVSAIPKSKNPAKDTKVDSFEGLDVASMTVAEIAAKVGKTERGVKAMLTRRGLSASDYTAKKSEKADAE